MAKAKTSAEGPKSTYECLVQISHDNEFYAPGEQIDLTPSQATEHLMHHRVKPLTVEISAEELASLERAAAEKAASEQKPAEPTK